MSEAAQREEEPATPEQRRDALKRLRELGYADLAEWIERRTGDDE